jgi:hypothetical protein
MRSDTKLPAIPPFMIGDALEKRLAIQQHAVRGSNSSADRT